MIDFWLAMGLLLLAALGFLLLPVLRKRSSNPEADREVLNVALYQERLEELGQQQATGSLTLEQLEAGRAEAARELLSDTEWSGDSAAARSRGHRAIPIVIALLVPLAGLGGYLHWGSSDKVELTRELAQPPRSMEDMLARLERTVQLQPESSQAWYLLGRAYMSQERFSEASKAFGEAVRYAGRAPELLGQWAQAQYFAAGKTLTPKIRQIAEEALKANPREITTLGLLGIADFEQQNYAGAISHWQTLVDQLPVNDPSRPAIEGGIERARQALAVKGQAAPLADAAKIEVTVTLDPALKNRVSPGDTVFVFARADAGPPMPLAVKRLTVADLPATISLSDADAMLPELKLSSFTRVELIARVSRAGDPTRGEWRTQGTVLTVHDAPAQQLKIDRPDTK
ncbi:cytochrome c-type biogenesis protein CcmH [Pseudomonas duriflava]|uniref:Cytochrome c-type biogenesis protein CcmH n=1 Tax=Pseudomonas duriflava TaxID=459528 RepID=A0A562QAY8_9PSED|nr:c-type cytochrome biogenesis protein CcmI [Pseudomonas duriflava]TWI53883.1 cytochrome c-type biogenesis protein CcmH [Pseudomonas duriflava]